MRLVRLEVTDLRILAGAALRPAAGLNVLVGPNGSGKTSVLEAVHLLGSGRSFRTRAAREVIRWGRPGLRVVGEVADGTGAAVRTVGVEKTPDSTRIRVAGEPVRAASALAQTLPVVLITPESQRLLFDGAALRRQLVDWLMFHVEPGYAGLWQRFERVRRQRNASLRGGEPAGAVAAWDAEFVALGETLHARREARVAEAMAVLGDVTDGLLGTRVTGAYRRGWSESQSLAEALAAAVGRDRARGFTGVGPHRADLHFRVRDRAAQSVLSRGEGKLFVGAVLLAQLACVERVTGRRPLVLGDDFASELDEASRGRLLAALRQTAAQVFVTAVSEDLVERAGWESPALFHVERGTVREVI